MKPRSNRKSKRTEDHFIGGSHRDNFELLESLEDFDREIEKIRKHLKILSKGLSNEEEYKKWHNKMIQESEKMENDREFIHKTKSFKDKIRKCFENKDYLKENKILGEYKVFLDTCYDRMPINYLEKSVEGLIEEFHLPLNYTSALREYILFGKTRSIPAKNYTQSIFSDKRKDRQITFNIYTRLTKAELLDLIKEIRRVSKNLPQYRTIKNLNEKLKQEKHYHIRKKGKKTYDIVRGIQRIRKNRFKDSEKSGT